MKADELGPEEKLAVAELARRIFTNYAHLDPSRMEQLDTDDCTIWDLFEPDLVRGNPEARAAFRKKDMADSARRGPLTIELEEPIIVDGWGDVAYARYYLNYEFKPPGPLAGRVRLTTIARKIDGEWRRVHHHEGIVPEGRPPFPKA